MSNHITATQSELIVICYADGVRTIVPTLDWAKSYVIERIHSAVEYFKQDYDDNTHIGIVWNINCVLNGLGTSQCMVNAEFKSPMHYIDLPYRYDLGENEIEEDVKIFYKNYKYIKNKEGRIMPPKIAQMIKEQEEQKKYKINLMNRILKDLLELQLIYFDDDNKFNIITDIILKYSFFVDNEVTNNDNR